MTDKAVDANRSDVVYCETRKKETYSLIDVTVPNNTMETIAEKQRKYCELQREIKTICEARDI